MNLIKLNCQNCDGKLDIDIDNMIAYCPYCGQKLLFDVEQMNTVFAEREKTKRAQEKTKREQEKTKRIELENDYKERKEKRDTKTAFIGLIGGAVFFAILIGFCFFMAEREENKHHIRDELQVSFSSEDIVGENYETAYEILENDGFYNIELVEENDLVFGLISKENSIKSISINGDSDFEQDDWFPAESVIKITYHSFKD